MVSAVTSQLEGQRFDSSVEFAWWFLSGVLLLDSFHSPKGCMLGTFWELYSELTVCEWLFVFVCGPAIYLACNSLVRLQQSPSAGMEDG